MQQAVHLAKLQVSALCAMPCWQLCLLWCALPVLRLMQLSAHLVCHASFVVLVPVITVLSIQQLSWLIWPGGPSFCLGKHIWESDLCTRMLCVQLHLAPICCLLETQCVLTAAMAKASDADEALHMFLAKRSASKSSQLQELLDLYSHPDFPVFAFRSNRQVSSILLLHCPEA